VCFAKTATAENFCNRSISGLRFSTRW
jgi:hypothetical protein